MFMKPLRPLRRSFFLLMGKSRRVCVFVRLWAVVMQPCWMPIFSWITCGARGVVLQRCPRRTSGDHAERPAFTKERFEALGRAFTTGARQLVVHEAAVTMWSTAGL